MCNRRPYDRYFLWMREQEKTTWKFQVTKRSGARTCDVIYLYIFLSLERCILKFAWRFAILQHFSTPNKKKSRKHNIYLRFYKNKLQIFRHYMRFIWCHLMTVILYKPISAQIYLHLRSAHLYHASKSNPKSQFVRLRWICTDINVYWKHANDFVRHYVQHSYHESRRKLIDNKQAEKRDCHNFRPDQNNEKQNQNSDLTPLVINWHRDVADIMNVLHEYLHIPQKISAFKDFRQKVSSFRSKEV